VGRVIVRTAALAAAVAVLVGLSLPPSRLGPAATFDDGSIAGAVHVHSNLSDGLSSPEVIAATAARAGLAFLVFTDHGDATRPPDSPTYRSGVLCLDGVEVSTSAGHLLALGLADPSPFPLGGEPRDVLEDVHRLGGFGVAAHPDSPKPELAWGDWAAPVDGLELVNLDTAWRVRLAQPGVGPKWRLLEALIGYPFRPSEVIAALAVESAPLLDQWHALTAERPVAVLGGADAHARVELSGGEPRTTRITVPFLGYDVVFGALSLRVRPARPFTGDANADGALLLDAIRGGRGYIALDGIRTPPAFSFSAANQAGTAGEGETLEPRGPVTLTVRTNAPESFTTTFFRNGAPIRSEPSRPETVHVDGEHAGVYRVEVRAADRDERPLWIASNAIYVRLPRASPVVDERRPAVRSRRVLFNQATPGEWRIEAASRAVMAFEVARGPASGRELRVRWGLPGGTSESPYAAIVTDTPDGVAGYDRLSFTARAERPMRISVQLRAADASTAAERWRRSVYLDTSAARRTISFDEFTPAERGRSTMPDRERVRSIIFSVDTTNTREATSGRFWLGEVTLER
jgi:hypothetical protein